MCIFTTDKSTTTKTTQLYNKHKKMKINIKQENGPLEYYKSDAQF